MKLSDGALLFRAITGQARFERGRAQDHQTVSPLHAQIRAADDLHDLSGQRRTISILSVSGRIRPGAHCRDVNLYDEDGRNRRDADKEGRKIERAETPFGI